MKPPEHTFYRHRLIVLDKHHIKACFPEIILIIGLYKIASLIFKYGWFDNIKSLYITRGYCDFSHDYSPFNLIYKLSHNP